MPTHNILIIRLFASILMFTISFSIVAKDDDDLYYLTDTDGQTTPEEAALLNAVKEYDFSKTQELLFNGVNPNIPGKDGKTPLMIAARNKDISIAKLLIDNGANIRLRNKRLSLPLFIRFSALDYAVLTKDTAIVNFLLSAGAELNPKIKTHVIKSRNPAIIASQTMNIKMVSYLLEIGCKVSDEDRRELIVHDIKFNESMKNITRSNNGALLIRFWMNYGKPLTEKDLLKSQSAHREEDKQIISDYMQKYNKEDIKLKEEKRLTNELAKDFEPSREQELQQQRKEEEAAHYQTEYNAWENKNDKKNSKNTWIIISLLITIISVSIYIYKRYLFPPIPKQNQTPQQPPTSNIQNKTTINKQQPINPKPKKTRSKPKQEITEKGWAKDDTIDIKVSLLTIEDMINPIRLRNEHEKAIYEMIRYIRLLNRYSNDQTKPLAEQARLIDKLNTLWDKINPDHVRDVYKRSLYLIVEEYSTRDERIKPFLDKISGKKITKTSKEKSK